MECFKVCTTVISGNVLSFLPPPPPPRPAPLPRPFPTEFVEDPYAVQVFRDLCPHMAEGKAPEEDMELCCSADQVKGAGRVARDGVCVCGGGNITTYM